MSFPTNLPGMEPCPFCGARSIIKKWVKLRRMIIGCRNKHCPVMPQIEIDASSGNFAETEQQAIKDWNMRADK